MRFLDDYRGFTRARAALPYIAYTIALLACGALVAFPNYFYDWAVVGAKFIGVGASTALFTRFLGGMGLFKDAISDVLGDDKWLDRRNDLEDLLRRISRRLFLPGFQETSETTEFLSDFNNAIARMVMRSAVHRHGYYEIDVNRVVRVKWKDEAERTLEMTDTVNCDVVVFQRSRPGISSNRYSSIWQHTCCIRDRPGFSERRWEATRTFRNCIERYPRDICYSPQA